LVNSHAVTVSSVGSGQATSGPRTVDVADLAEELGYEEQLRYPDQWRQRAAPEWTMEADDVLLRYIFRNSRPGRHLEFGTWQGEGVLRCLEECDATIWTINVLEGEAKEDGGWAYSSEEHLVGAESRAGERLVTTETTWVRTDAYGLVGHRYLARGLGHRVCQIYCDSRKWDTRQYPDAFFDSVFIDGGHSPGVVHSDTWKAIPLVAKGGLVMWHDFCPRADALQANETAAQVTNQLLGEWPQVSAYFDRLFWVAPSWLLVGVRNSRPVDPPRGLAARVRRLLSRASGH
jgi:predicted O-methyltransferase YrrM